MDTIHPEQCYLCNEPPAMQQEKIFVLARFRRYSDALHASQLVSFTIATYEDGRFSSPLSVLRVLQQAVAKTRGGSLQAQIVSAQIHWSQQTTEDQHKSLELVSMSKEDAMLQVIGMAKRNTGDWLEAVFETP
ncbi:hypothetical protein Micbo1qcDRAFT_206253 [Microdochium bolleyi]|uniref:Uncharacterized protein n=1 Tax=Microdochium bolleyi TaxID=196109 RepID=A0A136IWJ5_9PEZI|nr:hypothetical protein Micbo1qcDRAFT_206253 [Microdochium bolleyi]